MTLTEVDDLSQWRTASNVSGAADYLIELVREHEDIDLDALRTSPLASVDTCAHVQLLYVQNISTSCGLQAEYMSNPPTIRMRRSQFDRNDSFTVLHELAHHLQQHDESWAWNVLAALPDFDASLLEEAVCEAFAAKVLIPDELFHAHLGSRLTAEFVATLYNETAGSQRACAVRALMAAPVGEQYMVIVSDFTGVVMFAQTNSEDFYRLPQGSVQEDLARLAVRASENGGRASGMSSVGLRYSTSNARHDLMLDLVLADNGTAFAVATPIYKYGSQSWGIEERVCNSDACSEQFAWTADIIACLVCGGPRCPNCATCECETQRAVSSCANCFTELSVVESGAGRTTHEECP